MIPLSSQAQQATVKGVVLDTNNEPLIGANVLIVGSTNGTVTDLDGRFQLGVGPKDKIEVSYMGYEKQVIRDSRKIGLKLITN